MSRVNIRLGVTRMAYYIDKEFETDDVTVLKETILKLDKEHGFDKIRVLEDVTVNFTVYLVD